MKFFSSPRAKKNIRRLLGLVPIFIIVDPLIYLAYKGKDLQEIVRIPGYGRNDIFCTVELLRFIHMTYLPVFIWAFILFLPDIKQYIRKKMEGS